MNIFIAAAEALDRRTGSDEQGAIGWLAIGIIIGALLVIGLIIKLLIPGD